MKKIRILNTKNKRGFYGKPLISTIHCLLAAILLLTAGCSKTLKAGDPIALTYSQVYMVGDATTAGWNIGSAIPMVPTPNNPNEFTWTGPLVAGEIKFPTAKSWTSDTFVAATAGQSISNNKALLALNGNPDLHWKLSNTEAGNHKITLNTKDQTVIFQK